MKTFTFCLLIYVLLIFYSCNNSVENVPIDMSDDRGAFILNASQEIHGLCWSADNSELYFFSDRLYAVNIASKVFRILDGRLSYSTFDRNLTLSNNGSTLLYISDNGNGYSVYGIGTNGQNLKELVDSVSSFSIALSTDNNYLAYRDFNYVNIYRFSDSTSRQYSLNAIPISFSPDGSKLMCVSSFFDNDKKIYLMNVSDGTNQIVFSFSSIQYGCARWENDVIRMLYNPDTKNCILWNSFLNTTTTIFTITEPLMYTYHKSTLNQGCSKTVFWTRQCLKPNINFGCDVMLYNLNLVNLNNLNKSVISFFKFSGSHSLPDDCIAFSSDGTKVAYSIDKKIYMRVLQ